MFSKKKIANNLGSLLLINTRRSYSTVEMAVHRMLQALVDPKARTEDLYSYEKQKIKLQIIQVTLPGALPPQYPCPPIILPHPEKKL